jgi:hypothetical protein
VIERTFQTWTRPPHDAATPARPRRLQSLHGVTAAAGFLLPFYRPAATLDGAPRSAEFPIRALILAGLVASIVGCGKGDAGTRGGAGGPSSATAAADDWTHKDLVNHLKAKGMKLETRPFGEKGVFLIFINEDAQKNSYSAPEPRDLEGFMANNSTNIVRAELCLSTQEAREKAGRFGDDGDTWGRFAFTTNAAGRPFLAKIMKSLP